MIIKLSQSCGLTSSSQARNLDPLIGLIGEKTLHILIDRIPNTPFIIGLNIQHLLTA